MATAVQTKTMNGAALPVAAILTINGHPKAFLQLKEVASLGGSSLAPRGPRGAQLSHQPAGSRAGAWWRRARPAAAPRPIAQATPLSVLGYPADIFSPAARTSKLGGLP